MIEPVTVENRPGLPATQMPTWLLIVPEFVIEPATTAPAFWFTE